MAKHEHTKQNNQNFVQISFNSFISKLKYKLEAVGIECVLLNEAYTSKCSTLDCEAIGFHGAYAGKRVKRGLFKSKAGKLMNADVNGSLNILRLGLKKDFEAGNKFNPIAIKRINELSDAVYFNWRPADIGCVSQPNGIDNTIEDF